MTKSLLRGIGAGLALAIGAFGQAPAAQTPDAKAAPLLFEVATIKPAPPLTPELVTSGKMHAGMSVDGARVDIGFFALSDLIRTAYKLKAYQVTGPDWLTAQRWDILAKMPEGATKEQVPEMLQALLAERFKLTFHRDSKEHSVYALTVSKSGLKMKPAEPDPVAPATPATAEADAKKPGFVVGAGGNQMRVSPNSDGKGATISGGRGGAMKMSMGPNNTMHMEFQKMPIDGLVEMIARFLDRPVVDMTELKGEYQVGLDLSMEDMKNVARSAGMGGMMGMPGAGGGDTKTAAPADAAPEPSSSIFNSVQQLGLKLESRKLPIEILVVDHMEKTPTEN